MDKPGSPDLNPLRLNLRQRRPESNESPIFLAACIYSLACQKNAICSRDSSWASRMSDGDWAIPGASGV
jgi:hypothetical protein